MENMKELGQEVMNRLEALKGEVGTQIAEQIGKGLTELKGVVAQEVEEKLKKGYSDPETKEKIERIEAMYRDLEKEMLRPDRGTKSRQAEAKTAGEKVIEDATFKDWKENGFPVSKGRRGISINLKGGAFPLNGGIYGSKSIISLDGLGYTTSAVVPLTRLPGIVQAGRQELRIRDIMTVLPTTASAVDYMKQNAVTNNASPQAEGVAKAESTITYTVGSATVRTIAHWAQITRQALDDIPGLRADIDDTLMYGLKVKEESEILAGDNLGAHLNGIITQASARASTYDVAGDTKLDRLRHAILQARLALRPCDGIVLNPRDMHDIELLKDENGGSANTGRYIVGDPRNGMEISMVWGKPVVESDSISANQFLVGAFRTAAVLYDRQQAAIEVSFEHGTNFTENEATILCEERVALAVKIPTAFVQGTF